MKLIWVNTDIGKQLINPAQINTILDASEVDYGGQVRSNRLIVTMSSTVIFIYEELKSFLHRVENLYDTTNTGGNP